MLPHPEVADYMQFKAADPDPWLAGMRKFSAPLSPEAEPGHPLLR